MKITNEELLNLLDDISAAIGSILTSHQQMMESSLYAYGIEVNQALIQKKRQEIEALRAKVAKMRQAVSRRKQQQRPKN